MTMIPGAWEPRRLAPVAAATPAPAPAAGREARGRAPRREMVTWLEVSIVTVALVAAMLLAMWASRA